MKKLAFMMLLVTALSACSGDDGVPTQQPEILAPNDPENVAAFLPGSWEIAVFGYSKGSKIDWYDYTHLCDSEKDFMTLSADNAGKTINHLQDCSTYGPSYVWEPDTDGKLKLEGDGKTSIYTIEALDATTFQASIEYGEQTLHTVYSRKQ